MLFFKPGAVYSDPIEISDIDERSGEERVFRCRSCGQEITSEKHRVPISGQSEHTFTNPHGFVFTLGCFTDAPGCRPSGPATTEFTWFDGYAWRYAACGSCGIHLGWEFTNNDDLFFGLILNRIAEGG